MSRKPSSSSRVDSPSWRCPACGGVVRMTGTNERSPLECDGCDARYRHPRLALLLSLALPGLGSLYQRRSLWGGTVFVAGTGAFVWTLWRLVVQLRAIVEGATDLLPLLQDASLGTGVVMLAYALDITVVWLRRDHLQRC